MQPDEDIDTAAARELAEETGLTGADFHLEQLASYGDPDRDPRMRVVTVAYWSVCAKRPEPRAGSDAAAVELMPVDRIEGGEIALAFDHGRILRDALERLRARLETTALGAKFLPPTFRIGELRRVYEVVWSTRLDPGNFQRGFRVSGAFERCQRAKRTGKKAARQAGRALAPQGFRQSILHSLESTDRPAPQILKPRQPSAR